MRTGAKLDDPLAAPASNRFVGGVSGRTGTTWLLKLLGEVLGKGFAVIPEVGFFVLSQFRYAPYELYQLSTSSPAARRAYLRYFRRFALGVGFDRRRMFRHGLEGLRAIVPKRALRTALAALETDLDEAVTLAQHREAFGRFYSRVLTLHAVRAHGTREWISKEPPYGRHLDDLWHLIPDCRVVVTVRDGRDVALSMAARGWAGGSVRGAIDRWRHFTEMTLRAAARVPDENHHLVKYEDLVGDFEARLRETVAFLRVPNAAALVDAALARGLKNGPRSGGLSRWEREMEAEDLAYFETSCGPLLETLGYRR